MPSPCDLCAAIDSTGCGGTLNQHLFAGQQHVVARTTTAAAVPTIGAFVPGYLLVVPTTHATSIGRLAQNERRGVHELTELLADRLANLYGMPVLGFEYGLNAPGARRIEHGHLHLLPTTAGAPLRQFLRWHLPLTEATSMEHLPTESDSSYISVYEPGRPLAIYPVANDASPRIRLRELVAQFDPRVSPRAWDWERNPFPALIRTTVNDLAGSPAEQVMAGVGRR
ncbi:HIT family protein [Micromonospora zamorensis]|uniref:HIT family protein n=1 Tax=Micromonospora zamorensis TaxID=709883 RepID=UPI0033D2FA60